MPAVHLLITGKVQGVFYRATARSIANELGIKGWIKNNRQGDVEAIVSGTEEQLKEFISWCKQGPEEAEVKEVIANETEDTGFKKFEVIR